jgi:2-aminoadipate transaminase
VSTITRPAQDPPRPAAPAAANTLPLSALGSRLRAPEISALMTAALENQRLLSLAAGFTDSSTLPVADVQRAVDELASRPGLPEHLQYGSSRGRPGLRELIAGRSIALDGGASRDIDAARTLVGNGSQQLLYLAMQVLCDPGDIVLVERPSYFVFLDMLKGFGVRAVPLPCTDDGVFDSDDLRAVLRGLAGNGDRARLKAVYLMSYFDNPSGRSRSEAEKNDLAAALREAGMLVPIIEDNVYRELWFDEPWPARSIFALRDWDAFPKLMLGTLTKPYASGLKIGYSHGSDARWLDRMAWLKGHHDFGSANFNQAVLEHIVARGGLDEHLAQLRPAYAAKMRVLDAALEDEGLRDLGWRWSRPGGGLYLWLEAPPGIDTSVNGHFWNQCMTDGVLYVPGGLCIAGGGGERFVRLSYGVLDPDALREAGRRFVNAARHVVGV